jgi:hypothetical protein
MKVLGLAGIGVELLAAVATGLYVNAKYKDRVWKEWDKKHPISSETAMVPGAWLTDATDDDDDETDPEKLLGTWEDSRFKDRYADMVMGWGEWIWDKLGFLGWARITLFIPAAIVLFVLVAPWILLRLPFLIVSFLLDRDNDLRLKIIVLSFGLGICLELADAAVG